MNAGHQIHIVAGPTASGKSARALELASSLNGVIVNCDSIQIYDGLPILTAQPDSQDKASAPHKLYGTLHPDEVCSAGNWREMVIPLITDILAAGQAPIVVGGTGLYIRALMEGLSPIPDIPAEIRARVTALHDRLGPDDFYAQLKKRDPQIAARFHPNHKARLIRALEVLEATGKSLGEWQKIPNEGPPAGWQFEIHKIIPDRDTLYARCNERFLWMLENGAVEEVEDFDKRLQSGEVREATPLTKALGFAELRACIKGQMTRDEAIERAQAATRHYAKRQTTWFRHQL